MQVTTRNISLAQRSNPHLRKRVEEYSKPQKQMEMEQCRYVIRIKPNFQWVQRVFFLKMGIKSWKRCFAHELKHQENLFQKRRKKGRKNSATTTIHSECDSENDVIRFLFLEEKSFFTRKDDGTPHVEGQDLAHHVFQEKYMSVKRN
jgi:hypothetical protein